LNVAHHLAISDINNHNVVVGWKNGQMRVTETDIVTNHCLAETHESPLTGESVKRFTMLSERYAGFKSSEEGLQALKDASYQEETLWSVIYDKKNLTANIYFDCRWDEPMSFSIE